VALPLLAELNRRRVFRALVVYGVVAFAILQVIEPVMHGLHWPEAVLSYIVVALAFGFPVVVGLAWSFDVGGGSIERTVPLHATKLHGARLPMVLACIGVLAATPGVLYYFVFRAAHHTGLDRGTGATAGMTSIAVLPFASLSDQDNAYLAEGIHDELLRKLIEIRDLSVISRTSVLQYKAAARNLREIGEALGVASIVEGSVQRIGNRVRVQAKLIDARTDREMWADRYDRELTDVFAIEAAVAEEIADALKARISAEQRTGIARRPTENADAYDLYLRGLAYENRTDPKDSAIAESSYRQAIEKDPSFALARARLAQLLVNRYWFNSGTPRSVVQEVSHQAREAVRLQPELPEAHLALGQYYFWSQRDYDGALREFEIARPGDPNNALTWIALIDRRQGRYDESIRKMQRLAQLDPRSRAIPHMLAQSFIWLRRYDEAERAIQRALALAPDSDEDLALRPFLHELWKGDTGPAKAFLRDVPSRLDTWARLGGERDQSLILDEFGYWLVMLMLHNPQEALPVLDSIRADSLTTAHAIYPKSMLYADAHTALGDLTRARREYETALPMLLARVDADPEHAFQRCLLAQAYAALGRKEDALREARRAADSLPLSKDAYFGSKLLMEVAMVEGRVGETRVAVDRVGDLLSMPVIMSPAILRIDPRWAPLQHDPRFRELARMAQDDRVPATRADNERSGR
jgi:TolB-like protein/Tfp pilus assembly protein PilF